MILRLLTGMAVSTLGVVCAASAQADVIEIADNGEAQWIAGPLVLQQQAASPAQLAEVPQSALQSVPESAVADTAAHDAGVPEFYAAKITELSARYDLSPALLEALVWQESRWRANAVSHAGARGLAQLMPGTARDLGVDPDDPFANLEGGARYLREQLDRFDGDLEKALAAYNAGPGRVMRAGGIPNIRETQVYVAKIMGRLSDHSRSSQ